MDSRTAAHVLSEIAALLDLRAANRFKSRAYRTAATAILDLDADDLAPLHRSGELARVPGIGPATLAVVAELIESGESRYLEQLRVNVPEGVLEMMRVPGLGVAKIQMIFEGLGVTTMDELEAAARDGRLATLRGIGPKTAEKLIDAIAFARRTSGYVLFPRARAEAERLLASVRRHPDVIIAEVAGSVRRRSEVVRDIDIVASVRGDPDAAAASFGRMPGVREASLDQGAATLRFVDGTLLDLYCVTPDDFPVALWRATGSGAHVTGMLDALAGHALALRGDRLVAADGGPVPVASEGALYARLDLAAVPPELREGRGELAAAASGGLPRLVTRADIQGVLHCHSRYSDGGASIAEMADAARARGWSYLGISDHSESAFFAGGLSRDAVARQHDEIDALNASRDDFRILKGIEADILPSGQLDYDDSTLESFDYVIGSVHSRFRMPEAEMTARILAALDDPRLTILGHPTGRLLLAREPYAVDMDAVIEKAAERSVSIELNADPHRLDLDWRLCQQARSRGVPIAIGPDAHSTGGLDNIVVGIGIARKGWLEATDVLNTGTADDVIAFAHRRSPQARR
jgi:DNA polymerase (family 10)